MSCISDHLSFSMPEFEFETTLSMPLHSLRGKRGVLLAAQQVWPYLALCKASCQVCMLALQLTQAAGEKLQVSPLSDHGAYRV